MLEENEKILILTSTQSEASELYKFIASKRDLGGNLSMSNIHFGPLSNPPLNAVFSLIVYFSIPKKLESFFCHISMLYNNFYYRSYGTLKQLPKIHFHVFLSQQDFANHRYKVCMKRVSRLQINRLMKRLDDIYKDHVGKMSSIDTD